MTAPERNEPCPCGSGMEYKQCCMGRQQARAAGAGPALDARGCLNSGNACYMAGKWNEAVAWYRRALELDSGFVDAHYNLGNLLHRMGRLNEAVACYKTAISLRPDLALAYNSLGVVYKESGRTEEAIACYRKAIVLAPDHADAYINLGIIFRKLGELDEAIACYRKAITFQPDRADAYNNLGYALQTKGDLQEAIASYHKAIALKPDFVEAATALVDILMDLGQFREAEEALLGLLKVRPDHAMALATLTRLRKMTAADSNWLNAVLRLLSRKEAPVPDGEAIELQFALGKYYDDTGQYDLAFAAYSQANLLQRKIEGSFDRAGFTQGIDKLISSCTPDFIARQSKGASQSQLPVLIVGLPRSGTSLTEQIIASHPKAFGAGELAYWGDYFLSGSEFAAFLKNEDPGVVAAAAMAYEQCLRGFSCEADRIVDKNPNNFLWLGLIHAIFPQARIIHTRRNPVDTCLSMYFQNFQPARYSTSLEDLAYYYHLYDRLMRHWRTVIPQDRILDVPYEELIEDPGTWSRRIIEFIGLEWDEHCLNFHETERKVATPSNWQVRQKIYRSSRARWRNYERHLGPLLGLLDLDCA